MSGKSYNFLPSDDKILRLETCDFYSFGEINNDKIFQLQCCLKKILNPILILFYYNTTPKHILTEFFKSSRNSELKEGEEKDNYRNIEIRKKDLKFKFGSINLDYEQDLLATFENIETGNPFKWLQIVPGEKYAFMVFYYQGLPQYLYEGRIKSENLIGEFKNWYNTLMIDKDDSRENKLDRDNGIYISIADGEINYTYTDNTYSPNKKSIFKYYKGDIFKVVFLPDFVIMSKDLEIGTSYLPYKTEIKDPSGTIVADKLDKEIIYQNFRKINIEDGGKIDQEKLKQYQEMFKISHPTGKKNKKEIYLDYDFLTAGNGNQKFNKDLRNILVAAGMDKKFIKDEEIDNATNKENKIMKNYSDTVEKKNKLKKILSLIIRFMRDRNNKIKNLELEIKIRKIEGTLKKDLKDLLDRIDEYLRNISTLIF